MVLEIARSTQLFNLIVLIALTGMMIGGVTAFGIDELSIFVDSAVMEQAQVVMVAVKALAERQPDG